MNDFVSFLINIVEYFYFVRTDITIGCCPVHGTRSTLESQQFLFLTNDDHNDYYNFVIFIKCTVSISVRRIFAFFLLFFFSLFKFNFVLRSLTTFALVSSLWYMVVLVFFSIYLQTFVAGGFNQ